MRRAALVIALTLALVGTALAAVNPRAYTLRLADVGAGYHVESSRVVTNAAAAREGKVSPAALARWGRLTGFEVAFEVNDSADGPDLSRPLFIHSKAAVYKTASGAKAAYANGLTRAKAEAPAAKIKLIAAKRLGEQSQAFYYDATVEGVTFRAYIYVWRSRNVISTVLVAGLKPTLTVKAVESLASKQQRRVAATRR